MATISEGDEVRAIQWEPREGDHGVYGYAGRVGKIVVFSYTWAGGDKNKPYRRTCSLPGFTTGRWRGTEGGVKRVAERVLAKWLDEFGAVLATSPDRKG